MKIPMPTRCPNCGKLYDAASQYNPKAPWCFQCFQSDLEANLRRRDANAQSGRELKTSELKPEDMVIIEDAGVRRWWVLKVTDAFVLFGGSIEFVKLHAQRGGPDGEELALAERDPFLGSLMVFPAYDRIRDQPEFRRLTSELRLPGW